MGLLRPGENYQALIFPEFSPLLSLLAPPTFTLSRGKAAVGRGLGGTLKYCEAPDAQTYPGYRKGSGKACSDLSHCSQSPAGCCAGHPCPVLYCRSRKPESSISQHLLPARICLESTDERHPQKPFLPLWQWWVHLMPVPRPEMSSHLPHCSHSPGEARAGQRPEPGQHLPVETAVSLGHSNM